MNMHPDRNKTRMLAAPFSVRGALPSSFVLLPPSLHLLALDESDIAKFAIFGIAFLIWILNAVATMISKTKEEAKRRRIREELARQPQQQGKAAPPRVPLPMQRPTAQPQRAQFPAQRPPAQVQSPLQRPKPKQPSRRVVPPPIRRAEPAVPVETAFASPASTPSVAATDIAAQPIPQTIHRPVSSATAASIRAWLRPATLRQQFILTEVLQPPIAMRRSED